MLKKISKIMMITLLFTVLIVSGVLAYSEAPMLQEKVEEGELPTVDERLPANPLVLQPRDEIGQYGGTWRRLSATGDSYFSWEPLVKRKVEGWPKTDSDSMFAPNVAEDWEVNDNKTKYTFYLREGLKWSDGEPYTSEDIVFLVEEIFSHEDIFPAIPAWLTAGGEVVEVTAPDETTVVFEFAKPVKDFLTTISTNTSGASLTRWPKHFFEQFHPEFGDEDEIEKMVDEEGLDNWAQLLQNKAGIGSATAPPERPSLAMFCRTTDPQQQLQVWERNPYYFKVDPEGNQLPYIDSQEYVDIQDNQVRLMKSMAGEIDYDIGMMFATSNFPVLKESEEEGNYRVIEGRLSGLNGASVVLNTNQDYIHVAEDEKDKAIAELLREPKFRKALSVAINRDEVNEFVYLGMAKKRQSVMSEGHPAVTEEMASAHTEFDPDQANQLLDELGLDERDGEGWRTLPDGSSFMMILPAASNKGFRVDSAQIIAKNLQSVGLNIQAKSVESNLFLERNAAGEYALTIDGNTSGMDFTSDKYSPNDGGRWGCRFAPLTGLYYETDGDEGVEPEGDMAKLIELFEGARDTLDEDKEVELVREMMQMHVDNLWQIGVLGFAPSPSPVHNRLKNTPDHTTNMGWNPPPIVPEQYYIEE